MRENSKTMILLLKTLEMQIIFSFSSRLFLKINPFGLQHKRERENNSGELKLRRKLGIKKFCYSFFLK